MRALEILKACRERGQKRAGGLDLDEAISELEAINLTRREWYQKGFNEAMRPKTCEGCKWEQETKIIKTSIGDRIDICKLCNRYEKLQDYFDPKDNA